MIVEYMHLHVLQSWRMTDISQYVNETQNNATALGDLFRNGKNDIFPYYLTNETYSIRVIGAKDC